MGFHAVRERPVKGPGQSQLFSLWVSLFKNYLRILFKTLSVLQLEKFTE